jgi:hypothetical protein
MQKEGCVEVWFEGIRHLRLFGREGGWTQGTLLPLSLADVFDNENLSLMIKV